MKVASVQIARTVSKVRTIDRRTLNRHPRFLTSARVNSVSTRFIRTPLTCIVTVFLIGRRAENINNSYKKKKQILQRCDRSRLAGVISLLSYPLFDAEWKELI